MQVVFIQFGSAPRKFDKLYINEVIAGTITATNINSTLDFANFSGGIRYEALGEIVDISSRNVSIRNHKHFHEEIQPNIVRTPIYTTEIMPWVEYFDWRDELDWDLRLPDIEEFYPQSMLFALYNYKNDTTSTKNYSFIWKNTFNEILDEENETLMDLSEYGNLWLKGNLEIEGNLEVKGTTFTVNSEDVAIVDNFLILNSAEIGSGVSRNEAGIIIERGLLNNYIIQYDEINSRIIYWSWTYII